jgi:hypothetical protein
MFATLFFWDRDAAPWFAGERTFEMAASRKLTVEDVV